MDAIDPGKGIEQNKETGGEIELPAEIKFDIFFFCEKVFKKSQNSLLNTFSLFQEEAFIYSLYDYIEITYLIIICQQRIFTKNS